MKILLLNQTFHPDVVSSAQHLTDLALELVDCGHEVTVITSQRAYDNPSIKFARSEVWRGIKILRIPATGLGKGRIRYRIVDFASFLTSCLLRLLFVGRHDLVIALTSPPLISFLGSWHSRIHGAKFCYWIMDLNPDAAIAAKVLKAKSLPSRVLERMSRFSLSGAHGVVALDRFMCDRILGKGVPKERIKTIPPWSHDDDVEFDPEGRARFREKHGWKDRFVIMYSGNHSPCHPLDTLMRAAERLARDPKFLFCFAGGGSEQKKVLEFAEDRGLTNIVCLPYQPLDQLSGALSAADLHTVVMGDRFLGMIHPCKIYNIITVEAPILYVGPADSHIADIFAEMGDPDHLVSVRHGEVDAAVRSIQRIAALGSRGNAAAYQAAKVRFSAQKLLQAHLALVEELLEIETTPAAEPEPSLASDQ